MNISPLCIIQARLNSTRLPKKMLHYLGGETLIERGHRIAREAFGDEVVVAIPKADDDGPLGKELRRIEARTFAWDADERDVLGRFYACAHAYRWHPDSVIVRYTPDDPWKQPHALRSVARGLRLPVEMGGEAFTLSQLDAAWDRFGIHDGTRTRYADEREHITYALFHALPPAAPLDCRPWTIDTEEDLEACRRYLRGDVSVSPFDGGPWSPC